MENDKDMFKFFNEFVFLDHLESGVDVDYQRSRKVYYEKISRNYTLRQNINNTISFRRCYLKTT